MIINSRKKWPFPAIIIRTNDELERIAPANGKYFALDEIQKLVDGYIEVVFPRGAIGGNVLICDEEGQRKGKAYNALASAIYGSPIVGDVVLCPVGWLEG